MILEKLRRLYRLEAAMSESEASLFVFLRVFLPLAALLVLPVIGLLHEHRLRGELFEGGVVIYAILLLIELFFSLFRCIQLIGRTLNPQLIGLVVSLVIFSMFLSTIHERLLSEGGRTVPELLLWGAVAVALGTSAWWFEEVTKDKIRECFEREIAALRGQDPPGPTVPAGGAP